MELEKNSIYQTSNFKQMLDDAKKEKDDITEKYDNLHNDAIMKNMELKQAKEQLAKFDENNKQKLDELNKEIDELKTDKSKLEEVVRNMEVKAAELENDNQQSKFEFDKTLSLLEQKIIFNEKTLSEEREKYEKEIEDLKKEVSQKSSQSNIDLSEKITIVNEEKKKMIEKLELKKIELKKYRDTTGERCLELEKANALLTEQFRNIQNKLNEVQQEYKERLEAAESQSTSKSSGILNENEELKAKIEGMNKEIETLDDKVYEWQTKYEKDIALCNGQIEHYKSNSENAKKELREDRERFQNTIQNLTKKSENERNKENSGQHMLVESLNRKHSEAMENQKNQFNSQIDELKISNKELKDINTQLKNELMKEQLTHRNISKNLENEAIRNKEKDSKFMEEKENLITQMKERINELETNIDNERSVNRDKEDNLESKLKMESKKVLQATFDMDKLKSTHSLEIDSLKEKMSDYITNLERLQKRYDHQTREIAKLREAKKYPRKGFANERNSSGFPRLRSNYGAHTATNRGQSSNTSSMNGSQKENTYIGGKFIGEGSRMNKTRELDHLVASKSTVPLGNHLSKPMNTLTQFESREDERENEIENEIEE